MLPERIVQRIIDDIFVNEVDHRPDLQFVDYETVNAIVRLTIARLEKLVLTEKGLYSNRKVQNSEEVRE